MIRSRLFRDAGPAPGPRKRLAPLPFLLPALRPRLKKGTKGGRIASGLLSRRSRFGFFLFLFFFFPVWPPSPSSPSCLSFPSFRPARRGFLSKRLRAPLSWRRFLRRRLRDRLIQFLLGRDAGQPLMRLSQRGFDSPDRDVSRKNLARAPFPRSIATRSGQFVLPDLFSAFPRTRALADSCLSPSFALGIDLFF